MALTPVLSRQQIQGYCEDNYLLVSGLIPEAIAERAEAAMWRWIGLQPDNPEAWENVQPPETCDDPDVLAIYTPQFLTAAAQLGEGDMAPDVYRPPKGVRPINIFPQTGEWVPPGSHIDHAIKEHGHKTFPPAFRVATLTYLTDVEPHGGGTVVWPRSRYKIEALARSDPDRYEYMWVLNQEYNREELGDYVELTPKRGDVLFYHVFCAHSGSKNIGRMPRFALPCKW